MSKKIKENKVPLSAKEPDIKITIPKGKNEAVVTGVYKIRKGAVADTNTNTNTVVTTTKINEVKDTLNQALKISPFLSLFGQYKDFTPPYASGGTLLGGGLLDDTTETIKNVRTKFLQAKGKAERLSRSIRNPTNGKHTRWARLDYGERTEFINGQLKLLMKQLNITNPYDLVKNYKKDKRISGVIYATTPLQAGMWLKRFGLTPNEMVQYCFERMFATREYRTKHLSRSLDNYIDDNVNTAQPNFILISQWAVHLAQNLEKKLVHWRERPPKYTLKKFYNSEFYKKWCVDYGIERYKKYSSFCNFIKQSIIDYRKFCRRNSIQIPSVLRTGGI